MPLSCGNIFVGGGYTINRILEFIKVGAGLLSCILTLSKWPFLYDLSLIGINLSWYCQAIFHLPFCSLICLMIHILGVV